MTKVISLLGSTGSIGRQTLQVAQELDLRVAALTASKSVDLMEQQVRTFQFAVKIFFHIRQEVFQTLLLIGSHLSTWRK